MKKVVVSMDDSGWLYTNTGGLINSTVTAEDVAEYVEPKDTASADDLAKLLASGATADDLVKLKHAGVI